MDDQMDLFGEQESHQRDLESKRTAANRGTVTAKTVEAEPLCDTGVLWKRCVRGNLRDKELAMLVELEKRQSWNCTEADRFGGGSRGQAVVNKLTKWGWRITTVTKEGTSYYLYQGEPLEEHVAVTLAVRDLYCETIHWKAVAAERKKLDEYRCQQCGSRTQLETHHWCYELFKEDVIRHLVTLCGPVDGESCHGRIHKWISGSSVHFPRVMPLSMAQRIVEESRCS